MYIVSKQARRRDLKKQVYKKRGYAESLRSLIHWDVEIKVK